MRSGLREDSGTLVIFYPVSLEIRGVDQLVWWMIEVQKSYIFGYFKIKD
jgi:hypothetical protein